MRIREWPGSGPSLLLIHGFMGSRLSWGALPGRLGAVHAVAVDLPGHGESGGGSTPGECSLPGVARLLAALQDEVLDGPAAWLGYSMGARVALAAAVEGVSMTRLLLESGGPGLATEAERMDRRRMDEGRARTLSSEGMERFVDAWLEMPMFRGLSARPPEQRAEARAIRAAQDPRRMAAWLRGGGTGSQPDYRPLLPTVQIPVHLVAGARDAKYVGLAREMAALLPAAAVEVVPDVGHTVHLEAPEAWLRWVRGAMAGP
ncbi:MAG: 2-succinyl-6-hydroxy-2,4-cyclohexadiene-1-carboxylate synthase [Gemmatimonadota bacterium]